MNRRKSGAIGGAAAFALVIAMMPSAASQAIPRMDDRPIAADKRSPIGQTDDIQKFVAPQRGKMREMRREAATKVAMGTAKFKGTGKDRVIVMQDRVAPDGATYVSYPTTRTDRIFTLLAEFGDKQHPLLAEKGVGGDPGPLHNQIKQPDRSVDNTTLWEPDYNPEHYRQMMNGAEHSFRNWYQVNSSGRFDATSGVTQWIKLPYNEARYGHNWTEDDPLLVSSKGEAELFEARGYWYFVQDALTGWVAQQKAAGRTDAQIKATLATYDRQDRYDYDGDGDFNEPDGYIDHFSIIHAGEDESAGGGAQGADAIWAHSWTAFGHMAGKWGPSFNKAGGARIGNTGYYVLDYITQPENGGVGVFVHEYIHDLGLPDLYDTAGGNNGTSYWTVQSAGSWLSDGTDKGIGDDPNLSGPWEKLQLGWLDVQPAHDDFSQATDKYMNLGPAAKDASVSAQAVSVPLPKKLFRQTMNKPYEGSYEYWSRNESNMKSTLTAAVDLTGKSAASLSFYYESKLEADYDYAYVQVSTDGGANWSTLKEYTGAQAWTQDTVDLSAYAGQNIRVRFAVISDGGVNEGGFFLDNIVLTVDGQVVSNDGAETTTTIWKSNSTATGFTRFTGVSAKRFDHFYLVEHKTYTSWDKYLQTGPYSWKDYSGTTAQANLVEYFPYQDGMLVWYVDNSQVNNNTSVHPGRGFALPVDANPDPLTWNSGRIASGKYQAFDATFLPKTSVQGDKGHTMYDALDLTSIFPAQTGTTTENLVVPERAGVTVFDDSSTTAYYDTTDTTMARLSTMTAGSGIKVHALERDGEYLRILVDYPN